MSRVRYNGRYRLPRLACAAGAFLAAFPAGGQEAGLRGAIGEPRPASILRPTLQDPITTATTGIPAAPYEPASAGALPAETGAAAPSGASVIPATGPNPPLEEAPAPELDEESTGTTRAGSVNPGLEPLRMNERVPPIQGTPRRQEEEPYAPLGLRVGGFTVFSTLEQGLTWTSNVDSAADGEDALFSESTLRLEAESDWSRHRALVSGEVTYEEALSGAETSDLEGSVDGVLELDLADGLTGRATLGYALGRESASSPIIIADVDRHPLRHTIDASLGMEKDSGRLRWAATGAVSREHYGDAELTSGASLSQSDRNSTLALVRLRGGYELSPAVVPFVEVEAGRRIYDEEYDSAGYARSALRLGAHAGVALDLSEKLRGELSAGWMAEDFDDDRLETISGPALAAALEWSPMRGTLVRLDGSTSVEGSTSAGDSGSLLYSGTLRLERALRSNLTGDVALGAGWRDYAGGGHDLTLSGEAALTWWLNRYLGLTGRARHERRTSSQPAREYEETSIFMGMRLQR